MILDTNDVVKHFGIANSANQLISAKRTHVQDFIFFSTMFYYIFRSTYHRIGDLFCLDIFQDFRKVCWNSTVKSRGTARLSSPPKDFQTLHEGDIWRLCTVTFGPKSLKLNSRPVYCSQLYGCTFDMICAKSIPAPYVLLSNLFQFCFACPDKHNCLSLRSSQKFEIMSLGWLSLFCYIDCVANV